jgi:hypothetical protein
MAGTKNGNLFGNRAGVGLGETPPTALIQTGAGTAAPGTAPYKFTLGTLLGTPEAGAFEYDGTNLYITNNAAARSPLNTSLADVIGPNTSTDRAVARWNSTTGTVLLDSGVIISDTDEVTGVASLTIDGITGNGLVVKTNVLVVDTDNDRVGVGTATPQTFFHLVGTDGQTFRGVASGFTGSEDLKMQAVIQTTNATVTTLISVPLAQGEMIGICARVNGFQSDFSDAIFGTVTVGARRATGGNITLIGNPVVDILQSDVATNISVAVDTGTQTLLIQVTGVSAQNWNWAATFNYQKVLTNT